MTGKGGSGLYYGWIIAAASGVILLVTNGMTLGGLNVFDKPLLESLSQAAGEPVSLAGLKARDAITLAVSGLMAPLAGAAAGASARPSPPASSAAPRIHTPQYIFCI